MIDVYVHAPSACTGQIRVTDPLEMVAMSLLS